MTPLLFAKLREARAARLRQLITGGAVVMTTVEIKWERVPPDLFRGLFGLYAKENALAAYGALKRASPEHLARLHPEDLLPLLTHSKEPVRLAAIRVAGSLSPEGNP